MAHGSQIIWLDPALTLIWHLLIDHWTKSAKHEDLEYFTVEVRSEQSARTLLDADHGVGSGVFATPGGQSLLVMQKGLVDWLIILQFCSSAQFLTDRTVQFAVSLHYCYLNLNCCNMLYWICDFSLIDYHYESWLCTITTMYYEVLNINYNFFNIIIIVIVFSF